MESFYAQSELEQQRARAERDLRVVNTWKNCVLEAARKGKTPADVQYCPCSDLNPSQEALNACGTPGFRVIAENWRAEVVLRAERR